MIAPPILSIEAAMGQDNRLPMIALDLVLSPGDFAVIEVPDARTGAGFADLCAGLLPLIAGRVLVTGRDWQTLPHRQANALRGHIGRLFATPLRTDTDNVAARVLLARLHHTRLTEAALRDEASRLARRFDLPGLPSGPARRLNETDLLRAACVRAFLGQPRLLILELPAAAQQDDILAPLLTVGAEARGQGAAVIWLAEPGPATRERLLRATHLLRLSDRGLGRMRRLAVAA